MTPVPNILKKSMSYTSEFHTDEEVHVVCRILQGIPASESVYFCKLDSTNLRVCVCVCVCVCVQDCLSKQLLEGPASKARRAHPNTAVAEWTSKNGMALL